MTNYLVIGNGVAGTTAAEYVRKNDPAGKITILSEEDLPFYSRIRLIDYLGGDVEEERLVIRGRDWYGERGIELITGVRAIDGDPVRCIVLTGDGGEFGYDRLLLATGGYSFVPPITGAGTRGTFTLRNIRDAREIVSCCLQGGDLVMIGGGLLGLEAGNALRRRGMNVTVVEFLPRLLPRQLDARGGREAHPDHGGHGLCLSHQQIGAGNTGRGERRGGCSAERGTDPRRCGDHGGGGPAEPGAGPAARIAL